jgi:transposase
MLDQTTRTAILRLRSEGHGTRAIARALGISRAAVRRVVEDGTDQVPELERAEKAEPYRAQILDLYQRCKGNLVRVHEELLGFGAELSYQALTGFCRRHGIGHAKAPPAGHYEFEPGEEMQHDTSPHTAMVGGRNVPVQTASLALCFSRMLFVQMYPRFTRFECKLFLTDAFVYIGGACGRCVIDNTHVVVLSGTGKDMVPVPEMAAFAERFSFEFRAHEIGHANRSARVERPFDFIENNFLAGREFADWTELNREARAWCDRVNATDKRHLHASPRELFATEQIRVRPLPVFIPEVYMLHQRIVDTEGYVNVRRNRYSVPWQLIGRQVEVRETRDRIQVFDGPRMVAEHRRLTEPTDARVTLAEHRPPRNEGLSAHHSLRTEERRLAERFPAMTEYVAILRKRGRGSTRDLRWLLRMTDEYPQEALRQALSEAIRYGMADLDRLERMVLRQIARDFFVLPRSADTDPEDVDD